MLHMLHIQGATADTLIILGADREYLTCHFSVCGGG